ncbi:hypothetical protein [Qipengyuania aquimaris]|uniref:Uncharacterized protein n=1 Tax=Qipengyuania aquimaris TaxID=255984 RepID=A0A9Q3S2T2_9SPHN|nr:hypothetical protein [Qipengyuania aquimaris]MBY6218901.1 hypothetical protein [Qipengyuania aquimaris]
MGRKPAKISETVFTEGGLRLPLVQRLKNERWPWVVLILSPIIGVAAAAAWHVVVR